MQFCGNRACASQTRELDDLGPSGSDIIQSCCTFTCTFSVLLSRHTNQTNKAKVSSPLTVPNLPTFHEPRTGTDQIRKRDKRKQGMLLLRIQYWKQGAGSALRDLTQYQSTGSPGIISLVSPPVGRPLLTQFSQAMERSERSFDSCDLCSNRLGPFATFRMPHLLSRFATGVQPALV